MELPITKERLQNFRQNELPAIVKKNFVNACIKDITDEVYKTITTTDEKKCHVQLNVLFQKIYRTMSRFTCEYGYITQTSTFKDCIPDILSGLQERFIDSSIVVDPLKTYILIDWS